MRSFTATQQHHNAARKHLVANPYKLILDQSLNTLCLSAVTTHAPTMPFSHFTDSKVEDRERGCNGLGEAQGVGFISKKSSLNNSEMCLRRKTLWMRFDMLLDLRGLKVRGGRSRSPVRPSTLEKASAMSSTISTSPTKVLSALGRLAT